MGRGSIKVFNSSDERIGSVDYVTARIWLRLKYVSIKEMDPVLNYPVSLIVTKGVDEVVESLLFKNMKRRNPND